MILVVAASGLGNQLFHYAFGRYIQFETSKPVSIWWGQNPLFPYAFRYFALDKFAVQLPIMRAWPTYFLVRLWGSKLTRSLLSSSCLHKVQEDPLAPPAKHLLYDKKHVLYAGGWWWTSMVDHVRDLLIKDLQFVSSPSKKSQEIAANIKARRDATALHIRAGWGDGNYDTTDKGEKVYTGLHQLRSLSADYYAKAIPLIERKLNKPTFFVFTDILEKARSLLAGIPKRSEFVYVDPAGRAPWEDLYLMSQCSHFVLSNSTFAWWGCWLAHASCPGEAQLIIMPANWYGGTGTWLSQRLQIGANTIRIPNTV